MRAYAYTYTRRIRIRVCSRIRTALYSIALLQTVTPQRYSAPSLYAVTLPILFLAFYPVIPFREEGT